MNQENQLNVLAALVKNRWAENAVEAVVGMLSTVVTEQQLQVLIDDLKGSEVNV